MPIFQFSLRSLLFFEHPQCYYMSSQAELNQITHTHTHTDRLRWLCRHSPLLSPSFSCLQLVASLSVPRHQAFRDDASSRHQVVIICPAHLRLRNTVMHSESKGSEESVSRVVICLFISCYLNLHHLDFAGKN